MRAPQATDVLALWERAQAADPHAALCAMLAHGFPDRDPAELAALPPGRQTRLLLDLRARVLGPHVELRAACPACGEPLEADLPDVRGDEPPPLPRRLAVPHARGELRFRLPTAADIAAVADAPDPDAALLARCVHAHPEPLPPDLAAAVLDAMAALDPDADVRVALECPACAHAWTAGLDVPAFFRGELTAWTRRFALEVDALARAYGWPEADILAMTPARRQLYLDHAAAGT